MASCFVVLLAQSCVGGNGREVGTGIKVSGSETTTSLDKTGLITFVNSFRFIGKPHIQNLFHLIDYTILHTTHRFESFVHEEQSVHRHAKNGSYWGSRFSPPLQKTILDKFDPLQDAQNQQVALDNVTLSP